MWVVGWWYHVVNLENICRLWKEIKKIMNFAFIQLRTFKFLYGLFIENFCIFRPGVPLEATETAKQVIKN
jgi:hypothetical protein